MDEGVLWPIARVTIALIGVSALAWVALAWLSRRGFGSGSPMGRLKLIERLALGPRRQLYLVRADARVFLLGAAEGGSLSLIAELETEPDAAPGPGPQG